MNNYEHLAQGGKEAFLAAMYDPCTCCNGKCEDHDTCAHGWSEWCEAEYVEPDSWEKLLEDLDKAEYITPNEAAQRIRKLRDAE